MSLRICKIFLRVLRSYLVQYTKSSKLREFVWVVASPPWRRGPQVRAPWHHGGHGAVDIVGPMVPPGRASGRGYAGVYTDRLKWALGAVLVHSCTLLHRCNTARPAGDSAGATKKGRTCGLKEGRLLVRRLTKRRSLRPPRRTECAFPLHHRPGGVGRDRPPACGALWKVAQLGKCARATPRQAAGGLRRGPAGPDLGPDCTEKRSLGRGPR